MNSGTRPSPVGSRNARRPQTWPVLAMTACALLLGCAPIANLRPASGLMPGRELELGAGGMVLSPRPSVDEPWRAAAQLWTTGDADPLVSLSAIGAFDTEAFALGGALRLNLLRADRAAAGVEVEAGYAWAALSLPFAVRAFDETWLYTAPRAGNFGTDLLLSAPLGVSARLIGGFMLRGEAQVSWQDLKRYNRRTHLGGGAAYQL